MNEPPSGQTGTLAPQQPSDKVQRLRLRFARGREATSIGHLDLTRVWERAIREAGLRVSYSQGSRPQARLTLAAGLPLGVTSEAELLDVVLAARVDTAKVIARIDPQLPAGLTLIEVREVGMGLPSLPSSVRWSDYVVDVSAEFEEPALQRAVDTLIAAARIPWEDTRGEKTRHYDLRPLVHEIHIVGPEADAEEDPSLPCAETVRLSMRLRCDPGGVGRPDQVVKALGLSEARRIHRRRLVLNEVSPAHDAWRRRGRFLQ